MLAFLGTISAALSSFGREGSFAADAGKRDVPRADSCLLVGNMYRVRPRCPWAGSGTAGLPRDPGLVGTRTCPGPHSLGGSQPCPKSRDPDSERRASRLGVGTHRQGGGCTVGTPTRDQHAQHAPSTAQHPSSAQQAAPQGASSIPPMHGPGTWGAKRRAQEQPAPWCPGGAGRIGVAVRRCCLWAPVPAAVGPGSGRVPVPAARGAQPRGCEQGRAARGFPPGETTPARSPQQPQPGRVVPD